MQEKHDTVYQEIFASLNFRKNGNISIVSWKIFLQMIHMGNIKGVAWQHFHKI